MRWTSRNGRDCMWRCGSKLRSLTAHRTHRKPQQDPIKIRVNDAAEMVVVVVAVEQRVFSDASLNQQQRCDLPTFTEQHVVSAAGRRRVHHLEANARIAQRGERCRRRKAQLFSRPDDHDFWLH